MLKEEFEKLVGYEVSDSEYRVIECCYMAAGDDVDKQQFCEEWKKRVKDSEMFLKIADKLTDDRSQAMQESKMAKTQAEKIARELAKRGLKWNAEDECLEECEAYEAIKTFEDAVEYLGENHPYVIQCKEICESCLDGAKPEHSIELVSYLRLRVICAAINGLKDDVTEFPKFEVGEYIYWPWYWFYKTKQDALDAGYDEDEIVELPALVGSALGGDPCGVSHLGSIRVASYTSPDCGGALVLRDRNRAIYCGKQFMAEWLQYYTKREVKK